MLWASNVARSYLFSRNCVPPRRAAQDLEIPTISVFCSAVVLYLYHTCITSSSVEISSSLFCGSHGTTAVSTAVTASSCYLCDGHRRCLMCVCVCVPFFQSSYLGATVGTYSLKLCDWLVLPWELNTMVYAARAGARRYIRSYFLGFIQSNRAAMVHPTAAAAVQYHPRFKLWPL